MDVSSDVRDVLKEIQDLEKEAGKHNQVSIPCASLTNYINQRGTVLSNWKALFRRVQVFVHLN